MKQLLSVILLLLLSADALDAAQKMRIAIMDFRPEGVDARTARTLSNMLRTDLVKTNRFIVVERTQMDQILKEQGFQMTGCTDAECAVQIGRLMSANRMLLGEVGAVGTSLIITVRIVDVERGVTDFAEKETAVSEDGLPDAVANLTRRLVKSIKPKVPAGFYGRGFVPGWGQFYAGEKTKGYIFAGAFVLSACFTVYAHVDYVYRQKEYEDLRAGESQSVYDEKYRAAQRAGNVALASAVVVGAVYAANLIDVFFFTKNVYTEAGLTGRDYGFFAGFDCYKTGEYALNDTLYTVFAGYRF